MKTMLRVPVAFALFWLVVPTLYCQNDRVIHTNGTGVENAVSLSATAGANPTKSLEAGMSIASALTTLASGGKLVLDCGTFAGGFTVNKSVAIVGAGPCTRIVAPSNSDGIYVTVSGVVLQNFTVTSPACIGSCNYKGVKVGVNTGSRVNGFTANNLTISGAPSDGLAVYNSSNITVTGGVFSGNGLTVWGSAGLFLHDVTGAVIDGVTANGNGPSKPLAGVGVKVDSTNGSSNIVFKNSTANGNGYWGFCAVGIHTSGVKVLNNSAAGNAYEDYDFHRSQNLIISNNYGDGTTGVGQGIGLQADQNVTVAGNVLENYYEQSLLVSATTEVVPVVRTVFAFSLSGSSCFCF